MGTNEGLAILELPESFSADLETFKLHPALLDVAVGFAKQIAGGEGNYLPLSYKRFRLNQPLSKTLYSYAQYSEARSSQQVLLQFDIMIMDEHGNVLAEIEEYTLRRIDNATARFEKLGKNDPGNMMTDESLFSGAILNADGVEVFKRLLGKARLHQVIVSPMNLRTLIEEWSFKGSDILERIDSVQLPKITHQRPELETPFVAPRNEMEQMIAHIWQEMLGIKRMGIQDDFFMLGGDSLLGVQLISRLQEVFPVDLPLAILFEHPTIAQMAMAVAERLAEQVDKDMLSEL
jgi:polyketide synthase PksJ